MGKFRYGLLRIWALVSTFFASPSYMIDSLRGWQEVKTQRALVDEASEPLDYIKLFTGPEQHIFVLTHELECCGDNKHTTRVILA